MNSKRIFIWTISGSAQAFWSFSAIPIRNTSRMQPRTAWPRPDYGLPCSDWWPPLPRNSSWPYRERFFYLSEFQTRNSSGRDSLKSCSPCSSGPLSTCVPDWGRRIGPPLKPCSSCHSLRYWTYSGSCMLFADSICSRLSSPNGYFMKTGIPWGSTWESGHSFPSFPCSTSSPPDCMIHKAVTILFWTTLAAFWAIWFWELTWNVIRRPSAKANFWNAARPSSYSVLCSSCSGPAFMFFRLASFTTTFALFPSYTFTPYSP